MNATYLLFEHAKTEDESHEVLCAHIAIKEFADEHDLLITFDDGMIDMECDSPDDIYPLLSYIGIRSEDLRAEYLALGRSAVDDWQDYADWLNQKFYAMA